MLLLHLPRVAQQKLPDMKTREAAAKPAAAAAIAARVPSAVAAAVASGDYKIPGDSQQQQLYQRSVSEVPRRSPKAANPLLLLLLVLLLFLLLLLMGCIYSSLYVSGDFSCGCRASCP